MSEEELLLEGLLVAVLLLLDERDEELLTPLVLLPLTVRGAVVLMVVPLKVLESSPLVEGLEGTVPLSVVPPFKLPEPGRTEGRTDEEVVVPLVSVAICVPPLPPPRRSL